MWKWIVGIIAAIVIAVAGIGFYVSDKIYPRFDHIEVAAADFDKTYSPAQLRADFRFLTATVEHIHPDIAAVTDAATYPAAKAETLAKLGHPMTRADFFRVLAPFMGNAYRDGHTQILAPEEEWQAFKDKGGTVPPFAIAIARQHIAIAAVDGVDIPVGAELIALNGVDAATLRTWLVDTQTMEAESGKVAYAAKGFAKWIWAYGIRPPYVIAWRRVSETGLAHAGGIPVARWNRMFSAGNGQPVRLTIENGIATLAIANFEMPWDKYQGWLKGAFAKIHAAKVRAVILDLRENNGGDTRQSDELQTYLSTKQLPAMQEVRVHTTPEVKAMYRTLLPEGFRWIPLNTVIPMLHGIQIAPDNGIYSFQPEASAPGDRGTANTLAYTGDLYVLIGSYTYSTAVIAAAPYKFWKRAIVIGGTTSEPMTFFGDNYEFDLPNTKLQVHVSHKLFRLFGSKGPLHGLEPDIAVTPQYPDALAIAMRQIAMKQRRN